jgi:hypothetical protein
VFNPTQPARTSSTCATARDSLAHAADSSPKRLLPHATRNTTPAQAELAYQRASELNDKAAAAWQGLSELYHDTQQWGKAAEADQALVRVWRGVVKRRAEWR